MGYNFYHMCTVLGEVDGRNPIRKDCSLNPNETYDSWGNATITKKQVKVFDRSFCRDILCSGIRDHFVPAMKETLQRRSLSGVRCFGTVYNQLARYFLEDKSRTEVVENFIWKNFGIKLYIESSIFEGEEKCDEFPTEPSFTYQSESHNKLITEDVRGYLTLYFKSWENYPELMKVSILSWILEFFREYRLIGEIVDGNITDIRGLARGYLRLSIDRKAREDTQYLQYGFVNKSYTDKTYLQVLSSIMGNLAGGFNSEGSDSVSMLYTAVYVSLQSLNFTIAEQGSGPVSQIMAVRTGAKELVESFIKFIDDKELIEKLKAVVERSWITRPSMDAKGVSGYFAEVFYE